MPTICLLHVKCTTIYVNEKLDSDLMQVDTDFKTHLH